MIVLELVLLFRYLNKLKKIEDKISASKLTPMNILLQCFNKLTNVCCFKIKRNYSTFNMRRLYTAVIRGTASGIASVSSEKNNNDRCVIFFIFSTPLVVSQKSVSPPNQSFLFHQYNSLYFEK